MAKYSKFDTSMVLFDDCPSHTQLELCNSALGVDEVCDIIMDLSTDTLLRYFGCANNISFEEAASPSNMAMFFQTLQRCLYKNRNLLFLDFASNHLFSNRPSPGNEHMTDYLLKLTEILCDSSIEKIDLSGNCVIGKTGTQHTGLGNLVKRFLVRQGKAFICRHNGLHSQSFALIADGCGIYSSLQYLDLSDNFGGVGSFGEPSSNGMLVLCTHLRQTPKLKVLKLARNRLRDEDFSHVAWAITGMTNLKCLDLSGNLCHSAGMEPLREAIDCLFPSMLKGEGLRELDLSDNPLGPLGSSYMASFLKKSETLVKLNISNIGMDKDSSNLVLQSLKQNDALLELYASCNDISAVQEQILMAEINVNIILDTLRVDPLSVDAGRLSVFVYEALANKLSFLSTTTLWGLWKNPSFNVPLTKMQIALHMLAPPSRQELVHKVVESDPKLPERLREVRRLDRRMHASQTICKVIMPWYRKIQQKKRIDEALKRAMSKQASANYKVKEGIDYD